MEAEEHELLCSAWGVVLLLIGPRIVLHDAYFFISY